MMHEIDDDGDDGDALESPQGPKLLEFAETGDANFELARRRVAHGNGDLDLDGSLPRGVIARLRDILNARKEEQRCFRIDLVFELHVEFGG